MEISKKKFVIEDKDLKYVRKNFRIYIRSRR